MKTFRVALLACAALGAFGQKQLPEAEQKELSHALSEAGNSSVEFARVIEKHLEKYPKSPQRDELERALVKAAMEARDDRRTLLYGERVLAKSPDKPDILESVTRLLLRSEEKSANERALGYARKLEELLRMIEKQGAPGTARARGQMMDEVDRAMARSLAFQARATGNLGKPEKAVELARKSYERQPTAEAARELGRWLARTGKTMEAVERYADAFTMSDPATTDAHRSKDRAHMAELYKSVKGTEAGLGDLVLAAYDRTAAAAGQRLALQRERNPNADLTDPMQFTLSGLEGDKLPLASLNGKVVVMDFWATWCGPCRVQHPLYEQVKKRFAGRDDVVFLGINTDEDTGAVEPFIKANQWSRRVYFEDGLAELLRITSIPTTIVLGKDGRVFSRMNGFVPDRFVAQLTERIEEALSSR